MAKKQDQSSLEDIVITSEELYGHIATVHETEALAADNRNSKKQVKKLLNESYPNAINSDDDGSHSGFVIVRSVNETLPAFRIQPKKSEHDEHDVTTHRAAGDDWADLKIEQLSP